MAELLKGMAVANAMKPGLVARVEALHARGVTPRLGVVRVGERPDDIAYERSVLKRFEGIGVEVSVFVFPAGIDTDAFLSEFTAINQNPAVHGILLFRPLPRRIDAARIEGALSPAKDMDCMHSTNLARVFAGDPTGYAPCTPEGVMDLLTHYEVDLTGKRVTLVGRSLVVGRPLAVMLMAHNATVTVCHTRTVDLPAVCRGAEIIVAAAGAPRMIGADYVAPGAIVIDVGVNVDENGNLCGDVDFDAVEPLVAAITPVPGGVGTVTTSVLARHVIRAAEASIAK